MEPPERHADLVVKDSELLVTLDEARREIAGGWVAITGGLVSAIGPSTEPPPLAKQVLSARGCLVTPGLVNTHHHLYQNLTRSYKPAVGKTLFEWLRVLYPLWSALDEEAVYLSAWVGLAELALSGCTTSTDHLYIHPQGTGNLIAAEIQAAMELGIRFHPTRGSMDLSTKDGGLPPDSVVQDRDAILDDSKRVVERHHDPSWGAMVRIALAPCSPFSASPGLMADTAALAEQLDVRLHTHLAEDPDEDAYAEAAFGKRTIEHFDDLGWMQSRTWVAHCVYPNAEEIQSLGRAGVGVAHCPSSNMLLAGGGIAPVTSLRSAGSPVGLGCDGSSSNDAASMWLEARTAMLLGRLREGPSAMSARDVLEIATRGSAACLGRVGELGTLAVGSAGDLVCWPLEGLQFAGAMTDPVEAWLRCGPSAARHTVVAGRVIVRDCQLDNSDLGSILDRHYATAKAMQSRSHSAPC